MSSPPTGRANRLAREKSPYLLQHAHNPVDWYPWGDEAFAKARAEDKPIFLSIGYSTCHWCHVMERESFENEAVAVLLNRDFVPVKVDREERPDVDRVYMSAMQAMGAGGGWPLSVFLTPDLEPFFGGTYFPPDAMHGRAGMLQILPRVSEVWREQREQVKATGSQVLAALAEDRTSEQAVERRELLERCFEMLARSCDRVHGGFGDAPKFPSIPNLVFLQRHAVRDAGVRDAARAMVERQLDAMLEGGIHDHLGGGFHRYSTDAAWRVPHFEKMLYDQAQIAAAFLEGWQVTGRQKYADAARGIFDYVARDLTLPEGGFASAEDADSEGEEGKFYVWTPDETAAVLGPDDAALFDFVYGVTPQGNFEHETSVLHRAHGDEEAATRFGASAEEVRTRLARARVALFEARERRPRPHRDDKAITAWNGLMISAFARGARLLEDPALARRAERAATFVWETLRDKSTGLRRRWRDGEAAHAGQLDDYAHLAVGLIDLHAATADPVWLERAVLVTETMDRHFWDDAEGGWFDSPAGDPSIRLRMKDAFDGAEIAGNSTAVLGRIALAGLLDREDWRTRAEQAMDFYARRLARYPVAMPQTMAAFALADAPAGHVVVAGDPAGDDTRALLRAFDRRFRPRDLLLVRDPGARGERLAALVPWVGPLVARDGRATAYVCVNYTCRLPITDPEAFAAQLDATDDTQEPSPR